jgi:hypothetical protein
MMMSCPHGARAAMDAVTAMIRRPVHAPVVRVMASMMMTPLVLARLRGPARVTHPPIVGAMATRRAAPVMIMATLTRRVPARLRVPVPMMAHQPAVVVRMMPPRHPPTARAVTAAVVAAACVIA